MHLESSESEDAFSPETQVAIARERDSVVALRSDLAARASDRWTSATVSARVANEALFVITPALRVMFVQTDMRIGAFSPA